MSARIGICRFSPDVARDLHSLPCGPSRHQVEHLPDKQSQVERPPLDLRRPGKVQKCFGRALQPRDFFFQHEQVALGESRRVGLGCGLHQDLHRHQRVAKLVRDAGRHLTDRGQLLGTQGFASAFLQSLDDRPDLVGDLVQDDLDFFETRLGRKRDRPHDFIEFSGRILNGQTEADDRPAIAPSDPEAGHQARKGSANPQQQQPEHRAVGHSEVLGRWSSRCLPRWCSSRPVPASAT